MIEHQTITESKMSETIIDFLIDIPLFDKIIANDLQIVAAHMGFIEIEKGQILFREGDKGSYVCFVAEGIIEVIKKASTGTPC